MFSNWQIRGMLIRSRWLERLRIVGVEREDEGEWQTGVCDTRNFDFFAASSDATGSVTTASSGGRERE